MAKLSEKIQKVYDSYKPQLYNLTHASVFEDINKIYSTKKLRWKQRVELAREELKKIDLNSLNANELAYLNDLHNTLLNYRYIKSDKSRLADREIVRTNLTNLSDTVNELYTKEIAERYTPKVEQLSSDSIDSYVIPTQQNKKPLYTRTLTKVATYITAAAFFTLALTSTLSCNRQNHKAVKSQKPAVEEQYMQELHIEPRAVAYANEDKLAVTKKQDSVQKIKDSTQEFEDNLQEIKEISLKTQCNRGFNYRNDVPERQKDFSKDPIKKLADIVAEGTQEAFYDAVQYHNDIKKEFPGADYESVSLKDSFKHVGVNFINSIDNLVGTGSDIKYRDDNGNLVQNKVIRDGNVSLSEVLTAYSITGKRLNGYDPLFTNLLTASGRHKKTPEQKLEEAGANFNTAVENLDELVFTRIIPTRGFGKFFLFHPFKTAKNIIYTVGKTVCGVKDALVAPFQILPNDIDGAITNGGDAVTSIARSAGGLAGSAINLGEGIIKSPLELVPRDSGFKKAGQKAVTFVGAEAQTASNFVTGGFLLGPRYLAGKTDPSQFSPEPVVDRERFNNAEDYHIRLTPLAVTGEALRAYYFGNGPLSFGGKDSYVVSSSPSQTEGSLGGGQTTSGGIGGN
jgi:hypothetical protein